MSRNSLAAAELDAHLVDEMMNRRGRLLGVVGGIALAMIVIATATFVSGFLTSHPYASFGTAFFLFMMAASLSLWSYGEYFYLSSIDRRRREAEQG